VRQGDLFLDGDAVEVFDLPDADLRLHRRFLGMAEADLLFAALRDETEWEQETAVLYGREVLAPRLTAWHGDAEASYVYSGVRHDPLPWTPALRDVRGRLSDETGHEFNSVLLNFYRDGFDSVSWHADDEPELGPAPVIASISLGAPRVFQMKHKQRSDISRVDIQLEHGSLLMMAGDCQQCWMHQIPKRKGRNAPGPRINLTFRSIAR
jgi:alkylated DNA repair dioxygenase AlkB